MLFIVGLCYADSGEDGVAAFFISSAIGGGLAGCGALFGRGIDRNIILKLIKKSREAKSINTRELSEIGIL